MDRRARAQNRAAVGVMDRVPVGRKLAFRDDVVAAVHAVDERVGGALGPVEISDEGPYAFRVAVRVGDRRLSAVIPNVSDGLPRDLAPFLTRSLETIAPVSVARDRAAADPFDLALVIVAKEDPEGWVVDDGDAGWRVSGVPNADDAPFRARFDAALRGEGVIEALKRWLGSAPSPDIEAIGTSLAERMGRTKIAGFGEIHVARRTALRADGTTDVVLRTRFRPSSSLADTVRGKREPGRIGIDPQVGLPRDAIPGVVLWASCVRDVLIAEGACAAPGFGLFYIEDRPELVWIDRAGKTAVAEAGPHVRFTADAPVGRLIAGPGIPLP